MSDVLKEAGQGVAMSLHVLLLAVQNGQTHAADDACEALAKTLTNYGHAIAEIVKEATTRDPRAS